MKQNSNKLLIAIVVGIVVIVIVAFLIVLRRPDPEYQADDTPAGVTHNYLLAIQQGDHQRAFEYLSPTLEHPADAQAFLSSIEESPWEFQLQQDVSLAIESTTMPAENSANVTVRQTTFFTMGFSVAIPNRKLLLCVWPMKTKLKICWSDILNTSTIHWGYPLNSPGSARIAIFMTIKPKFQTESLHKAGFTKALPFLPFYPAFSNYIPLLIFITIML